MTSLNGPWRQRCWRRELRGEDAAAMGETLVLPCEGKDRKGTYIRGMMVWDQWNPF
jgi:hypothetical protein